MVFWARLQNCKDRLLTFVMAAWNKYVPTWRISLSLLLEYFRKSVKKIQVSVKSTGIAGTLREDLCILMNSS
jgi:hypothetical protein